MTIEQLLSEIEKCHGGKIYWDSFGSYILGWMGDIEDSSIEVGFKTESIVVFEVPCKINLFAQLYPRKGVKGFLANIFFWGTKLESDPDFSETFIIETSDKVNMKAIFNRNMRLKILSFYNKMLDFTLDKNLLSVRCKVNLEKGYDSSRFIDDIKKVVDIAQAIEEIGNRW